LDHETLFDLAADREVRKAAGFREVAKGLDAEILNRLYLKQMEQAPRRPDAGKKYFVEHDGTLPKRGAKRDEDQLSIGLLNHAKDVNRALPLPARLPGDEPGGLTILDYHVPLKVAAADDGPARVDVLGQGKDDRMVLVMLRWLAASASRGSTGDTPLRLLLEGLSACAVLDANRAAVRAEAQEAFGVSFADAPPLLYLVASPRWWELARRREAQKGAAWINQLERLVTVLDGTEAKERAAAATEAGDEPAPVPDCPGVTVRFLSLHIEGEPAWEIQNDKPSLVSVARLQTAWESTAGRIKPKARPRPKSGPVEPELVEPDLSRPVRAYRLHDAYMPGDRIEHSTLGLGVVQFRAGPTKIEVLFDGVKRVLVHDRPSP
jgi:hypothetical protein